LCLALTAVRLPAVQSAPRLTLELQDYAALPITADKTNADKWTFMVVGGLSKGPMRFNALLRLIGVVASHADAHSARTRTRWTCEADRLSVGSGKGGVPAHRTRRFFSQAVGALVDWVYKNQPAIEAGELRENPASDPRRTLDFETIRNRASDGSRRVPRNITTYANKCRLELCRNCVRSPQDRRQTPTFTGSYQEAFCGGKSLN
jgi:hypothetical protein